MSEDSGDPAQAVVEDWQELYEHAPCGFLSMSQDGRLFRSNETLSRWTGYSREQLAGMRLHELLTAATFIFFETSFAPILAARGVADEISLDLRRKEGGALAVSACGAVVKDEEDKVVSIRMAFFKSVDRRRYEGQLVEAHERSMVSENATQQLLKGERETSELREQFIAVLGHDLRNPLASISAGVRLLAKETSIEKRTLLTETIQGSVSRMAGLIDNVLDFARGRLGAGIPLELRSVDLPPLLDQVVEELRLGHSGRAIEIDFDLPEPILCDPTRVGQLVSNLLGNALTHGDPASPIRIGAGITDGSLFISIANSGAPINAATMARLFQPFFRGEVRSNQDGLGLGLHISAEIAKAHGGTLKVESSERQTCFTFQMPLVR